MFGGAVDVSSGIYFFSGNGCEVDDVSGVLGDHQGGNGAGDVEESFYVGVYHSFPIV